MIIKKMIIENFRQFKERSEVVFSDNRMTLINGANGAGKSTLSLFFSWMLFDNLKYVNKKYSTVEGDYRKDKPLYNFSCDTSLNVGEEFDVKGTLEFEHNGEIYDLYKTIKYQRIGHLRSNEVSREYILYNTDRTVKDGIYVEGVSEVNEAMNAIIPRELSRYFVFDGEQDIVNNASGGTNDLKKAIYKLFDLNKFADAIRYIGDIDDKNSAIGIYYKKLTDITKNNKNQDALEKSASSDLEKYNIKKGEALRNLETYERKLKAANQTYEECVLKLANYVSTRDLNLKIENNKRKIDSKVEAINKKSTYLGTKLARFVTYDLLRDNSEFIVDILQDKITNQKTYPGINRILLDEIIKSNTCVCGRCLDAEAKELIEILSKSLPPNSYVNCLDDFKRTLFSKPELDDKRNELLDIKREIAILNGDKYNLEEENKKISDQIKSMPDMRDIEEKKIKAASERDVQTGNIRVINENVKFYEKKIKDAKETLSKIEYSDDEANQYKKKIDLLKEVKEMLKNQLNSMNESYRSTLEDSMKLVYNKMSSTKKSTIFLNDNYEFISKDEYNSSDKSGGQEVVEMYSYVIGVLNSLTRENLNSEYPLIIDGPFSRIDNEQVPEIIKSLNEVAHQTIVFTFDTRVDEHLDKFDSVWIIDSNEERNLSRIIKK